MLQISVLILAATLSRAPADGGWLDAVPAEADVAIRIGGMETVRKDLDAMLNAMSPALGKQAGPALEQGVAAFRAQFGDQAATQPFVAIVRAVPPENPQSPPFAIVVKSENYEGVLRSLVAGKDLKLDKQEGGYDSFAGPQDQPWFAAKKDGVVAFGPDKALVAAVAKSGGATAGKSIAKDDRDRFDRGDIGLYVNLKAIVARYDMQIDDARKAFMTALDQAGGQLGNAGMMESVKTIYAGLFDGVKTTDALAVNLDFAAEGLTIEGALDVKDGSGAAKLIVDAKPGDAAGLGKLTSDSGYFMYLNFDAKTFERLQRLGMGMLSPGGKPSPEVEAAIAKVHNLGRIENIGSVSIGGGMKALNVTKCDDPAQLLAATEATLKAMKSADNPLNFFSEITVTPNAEEYRGYSFTRADMTLDKDKLAKLQPGNPAGGEAILKMYGGDKISSWYAVKDKELIQVTANSRDQAKAIFDKYADGQDLIGASAGYKSIRAKLGKEVNLLFLISAQGLVGQVANQLGAALNNPDIKVPADLPKDPALIGVSATMKAPTAIEFKLVVPSEVGPVFEKGIGPVIQQLRPGGN